MVQVEDGADSTCATQEETTRRLLEREEMENIFSPFTGPCRPSSPGEPDEIPMEELPKCVQVSLAIAKDSSLQDLAVHAYQITEASRLPVQLVNKTTSIETTISAKLAGR